MKINSKLYIDKDLLLNNLTIRQYVHFHTGDTKSEDWVVSGYDLSNLPTVEAYPIIKAHWDGEYYECSNCHRSLDELIDAWSYFGQGINDVAFCPFCGAVMKGDNND